MNEFSAILNSGSKKHKKFIAYFGPHPETTEYFVDRSGIKRWLQKTIHMKISTEELNLIPEGKLVCNYICFQWAIRFLADCSFHDYVYISNSRILVPCHNQTVSIIYTGEKDSESYEYKLIKFKAPEPKLRQITSNTFLQVKWDNSKNEKKNYNGGLEITVDRLVLDYGYLLEL